ncbi:hypothetical protein L2E82_47100 [Cichorium intybus]|uniref:Uncharacterized protein n=1 Tax=Cichorium intybus TaxID=13427 RepID=A0ACB8YUJ7_CICIN|nr:hypothetical protein L2E82_47100 [Cichorium intybus]
MDPSQKSRQRKLTPYLTFTTAHRSEKIRHWDHPLTVTQSHSEQLPLGLDSRSRFICRSSPFDICLSDTLIVSLFVYDSLSLVSPSTAFSSLKATNDVISYKLLGIKTPNLSPSTVLQRTQILISTKNGNV